MKLTFEQRLMLLFGIIFIGISLIGYEVYKNNREYIETGYQLRHTNEILDKTVKAMSQMKDIETGERGYIISHDTEYLQPFRNSKLITLDTLNALSRVTVKDTEVHAKVDSLIFLARQKIDFVTQSIQLVDEKKYAEVEALIATKDGKRIMDKMRDLAADIQDIENDIQVEKRAIREKNLSALQNTFIVFAVSLILLFVLIILTIRDALSERAKSEAVIRRSNNFLDTILENIPNMIFVKEAKELRFVRFNVAGEKLLGYKREELLNKNDYDFFPKEQADFFTSKDREVMGNNQLVDIEEESIQTKTGVRWLHTKKLPITDADGNHAFLLGISEDITERKKTAELLRDSERQVQTIFAAAPDAIIVIDEAGIIIRWNPMAEALFQWSADEALGKTLPDTIIPKQHRSGHADGLKKFIETGYGPVLNKTIEMPACKKDGTGIFVELTISQTQLTGKYIFIGFLKDITERKKKADELKELYGELEKTVMQLQQANKEMEAFTYSVSHDLRAPLRIINGFAEILVSEQSKNLNEEGTYQLGVIMSNSKKMGQLIDDLLNLSRLGRAAVDKKRVDMNEAVKEVIDALKFANPKFHTEIKLEKLPDAFCDHMLIKQVWFNLIANAVKYSDKKDAPVVEIGSQQQDGKTIYFIKDNGVGFDMQYAGKLFGVFQRLHKVSEFEGTGVGLAIVFRIINRHGGTIWAEAKENEGATFYFYI